MERAAANFQNDLNLEATELRLGLPGSDEPDRHSSSSSQVKNNNKRSCLQMDNSCHNGEEQCGGGSAPKAQVVGWPPVRSFMKNAIQQQKKSELENGSGFFVKVSMDGAPYLRKIDVKFYNNYIDLLKALEDMFNCTICLGGSELAPTYEDRDGDWMLVGDVPWNMFLTSCKRLRIMKRSQGLGSSYMSSLS